MEVRTPLIKKEKNRLKQAIKNWRCTDSLLYDSARGVYRLIRYAKWKVRCQYRKLGNNFEFDSIFLVRTDDIQRCTEKEFDPYLYDGMRLGGNWDVSKKEFRRLDVLIAFRDHFLNGIEWKNTEYYRDILRSIIRAGHSPWNCSDENDLIRRFNGFDALYLQIKERGYKKQQDLFLSPYDIRRIDEISINLDRNGDLLFNNGAHRLSIAKVLSIEVIPVRVTVCHAKCLNFSKLHLSNNK